MSEAPSSARPGLALGGYPERGARARRDSDRVILQALSRIARPADERRVTLDKTVATIRQYGESLANMPDDLLAVSIQGLRLRFAGEPVDADLAMQAFAMIREISGRVLGMRHHDAQLLGGWVIYSGRLAQMQTGEGKTLTATLPASAAAMSGVPVHVITANDYLAARDAELVRPVYERLGLSVGVVTEGLGNEERRAAYGCDVTYCTNKQVAFDYLRDRVARGAKTSALHSKLEQLYDKQDRRAPLVLRGLCYAIVDEADSVLVDEARTPLILSRSVEGSEDPQPYREALALSENLRVQIDFEVDERGRQIRLTDAGKAALAERGAALGDIWKASRRREELVSQALAARFLYLRDRHYVVRDGAVQIVDDYTGRVMADRSWPHGLHQLVETKEDCELSAAKETLARMSYQRFFGRYLKLSGMTGTADGLEAELAAVYGLAVVDIPTHRPSRRVAMPERVFARALDKQNAILESVRALVAERRAVLIGTRSVADSESLGAALVEAGIDARVLNARQDHEEAAIVAEAGRAGRVTVATNMAGRGTDIPLSDEVKAARGLHVIVAARNEAARIDRQLVGRGARQGDPGSYQFFGALDDEIPALTYPALLRRLLGLFTGAGGRLPGKLGTTLLDFAQAHLERRHRRARKALEQQDAQLADTLAFSGRPE